MVLGGSPGELPPFPLTHAMIGYRTICTEANVVATSESAGNPAIDAVNVFTNEYWKPDVLPASFTCDAGVGVDVDYFGIAAHTLGSTGATIEFLYSFDNVTWESIASLQPENDNPIMVIFDKTLARYWRITVTGTTVPRLGVIYIGEMLQMQRPIYGGHAPLPLNRQTEIYNRLSEGGQFSSRAITRKGVATSYAWEHLTAMWYREFFDPFAKATRTTPFFIAWRPLTFPNEVGYVWTTQDPKPENMGVTDFMRVSLDVVGVGDD